LFPVAKIGLVNHKFPFMGGAYLTLKNLEIFYSESARHQKELPKKLYSNGLAFLRLEVNFPAMDV
jgi:hypothetical protein